MAEGAPDFPNREPGPAPDAGPELVPLEAHIIALRAELIRTQLVLRLTTAALVAVALALAWREIRATAPRLRPPA